MILLSWLFVSAGSFLFGASVLQLFGCGMAGDGTFFLPMLAVSLLAALLIRLFRRGRMLLCVPLTLAQLLGTLYFSCAQGMRYTAILPSALVAGFIPFHLLMLCQEPGEEYPPTIWYLGVILHALSLFLLRAETFAGAATLFKTTALLYFVFVIFALNELGLSRGMAGDRRPSPLMRWRNRIRAGAVALGLVIACNLESIRRAAAAALDFVLWVIGVILALLMPEKKVEYVQGGSGGMDLSALGEGAAEAPLFWRILEKIMYVVALVLALALTLLIIKKLVQIMGKVIRFLIQQMRRYAGQVNNAYEDTMESLVDWGEMRRALRLRREKRVKAPPIDWESLTPRESVRMRYKTLRRRLRLASDSQTARQVLQQEHVTVQAADLYDRARYSSQEISSAEADKMKEWLR